MRVFEVSKEYVDNEAKRLKKVIDGRYLKYRGKKPLPNLKNKIVIIVDDGLATGSTMMAAVEYVRKNSPAEIIVAVPVAPQESIDKLARIVDKVVCLQIPTFFFAIGEFYEYFPQVEDEDAIRLLKEGNE